MLSAGALTWGVFSTGSLSPVRLDWLINRSFASRMRTSAGIISPADRCTISPTTSSSIGISAFSWFWRVTVQVVVIMASSRSAALSLLDSCTNRSVPEITTIVRIITAVRQSKSSGALPNREKYGKTMSVMVDTRAKKNRMAVKGLINASASRLSRDFFFSWVTLLLPYRARLADTSSISRPQRVVCSSFRTSGTGFVAAYRMRRFCSSRITAFSAA